MTSTTRHTHWRAALVRLALLALVTVLAQACTCRGESGGAPAPAASADPGPPRRGGVLTMATYEVTTFDPILVNTNINTSRTVLHIFSRLVRTAKDGLSVEPDLAESWEISPDGRTYTFHLRPALQFSDGSKLRASDVKFSIERGARDPRSVQKVLYPPDFAVETPDDRTVVIKLPGPHASLLAVLAFVTACVVPEQYFKQVGQQRFSEAPIGSGPFVLAERKRGDRTVLRKNPHHWDAPRPYLDEIRLLEMSDEMTRQLKLQAGEVDMLDEIQPQQAASLESVADIRLHKVLAFWATYLVLNPQRPELQDRRVRQAISLAIDRRALVKLALFGLGEPATSYLPGLLYSSKEPMEHDVDKARRLLVESGHPDGLAARLVLYPASDTSAMAVVLKSQLEAVGIRLDILQAPGAEFEARIKAGEYELSLDGTYADSFDPVEFTMFNLMSTGLAGFRYGYKNPEIDALAVKAEAEHDPVKRAADYRRLEQLADEVGPHIPLCVRTVVSAAREDVHDVTLLPNSEAHRLWEVWKSQ